jgi:hypothetical protein
MSIVILSEAETLASQCLAQSKDPMPAGARTGLERSFHNNASGSVRGLQEFYFGSRFTCTGIPPPPLIFGLIELARNSSQNPQDTGLRGQNLDNKKLSSGRGAMDPCAALPPLA